MTKPWQTAAWRKKRIGFLKGKSCKWCGSKGSLVIHHHKHFHGLREYKRTITRLIREYYSRKENKAEKQRLLAEARKGVAKTYFDSCPSCGYNVYSRKTMSPRYKCRKCSSETDTPAKKLSRTSRSTIRRKFRFLFFKQHREDVDRLFAEQKEAANKEYYSFRNVMVLCKRCHFAKEKGWALCKICKQRFHKPSYKQCWDCFTKTKRGKEAARLIEPLPYTHPWCGMTFQIKRKWWDIEANPTMCCIKRCDVNPNSYEIALKHRNRQ